MSATNGMTRMPPHSRESERYLLGTMLRDHDSVAEIVGVVRAKQFYVFGHQCIFSAITALHESGKQADLVTVSEKLSELGQIDEIGGFGYIGDLIDCVGSGAVWKQYAETVRDASARRDLIHACNESLVSYWDAGTPVDELIGKSEQRLLEIAEGRATSDAMTLQDGMITFWNRLEAKRGNPDARDGVKTGWIDVDAICDGFRDSELVLIAARPSQGKSAWGLQFAMNAAIEQGVPTLFVSLEQSSAELVERMVVNQSRVGSHKVRRGQTNPAEIERMMQAGQVLGDAKLWIDDMPCQNMLRIGSTARRLKRSKGIGLLVVDYIQLVDADDQRSKRHEQVGQISRRMKMLAKELDIPVVCMAQVNRGSEDRADRKPRLAELRESGSLEQDADVVVILHRPGKKDDGTDDGTVEVEVAKNRNGPTGDLKLVWVPEYMRFENFAVESWHGAPVI